MKTLSISGKTGNSIIAIGDQLENCNRYMPDAHTVVITDTIVRNLYENKFPNADIIEIGTGEPIKTLQTIHEIYEQMIRFETDRESFVLAIGGGIVCDIAGFSASTYMRGINFGFVASTLLAQVDASIGGKNGVNVAGYKNMAGVFKQPSFAICDLAMLQTLAPDDYRCGLAEIVKHAIIFDIKLFEFIEQNISGIENKNPVILEKLIYDSVMIKSTIVQEDETEKGVRKKLNLGHTFGHAIEKLTKINHGQAVSIGIVMASTLAGQLGMIKQYDVERITDLLTKLQLPVSLDLNKDLIFQTMKKDKKRQQDHILLILPQSIGNVFIEKMSWNELYRMIK